jgi:hypothetical protein
LARFAAFFGERVFLAVFFFAAISLAPQNERPRALCETLPLGRLL